MGKNFLIKLIVLTFIILTSGLLLFNTCLSKYNFSAFTYIVIYFFSLTFLTHSILVKFSNIRFARFSSLYMLITGAKMFINIIFLAVYVWLYSKSAFVFILSFLVTYISYTVFEVIALLAFFREKNKPPTIEIH